MVGGGQVWPGIGTPGLDFWVIKPNVLFERSCLNPAVYMTWCKPCSKYMVIGESLPGSLQQLKEMMYVVHIQKSALLFLLVCVLL